MYSADTEIDSAWQNILDSPIYKIYAQVIAMRLGLAKAFRGIVTVSMPFLTHAESFSEFTSSGNAKLLENRE